MVFFQSPLADSTALEALLDAIHERGKEAGIDSTRGPSFLLPSEVQEYRAERSLRPSTRYERGKESKIERPFLLPSELEEFRAARSLRRPRRTSPPDATFLCAADLSARLGISLSRAYVLLREVGCVPIGRSVRCSEIELKKYLERQRNSMNSGLPRDSAPSSVAGSANPRSLRFE